MYSSYNFFSDFTWNCPDQDQNILNSGNHQLRSYLHDLSNGGFIIKIKL
jgi:hypothetical protein